MMNPARVRILIVDDHFIVRLGLVGALSRERDIEIAGEACNGQTALDLYARLRPDITLMDGILPDMHGVEVTRRIVQTDPQARIILISINDTVEDVYRAMQAGAFGYLPKSSDHSELLCAIRAVATGRLFMPPDLALKLADRAITTQLSDREIEVLQLVSRGKANKEIASTLKIGDGTVKTHIKHILTKLGAPDRTRAVTLAMERGLLRE